MEKQNFRASEAAYGKHQAIKETYSLCCGKRNKHQIEFNGRTSGGDADRFMCDSSYNHGSLIDECNQNMYMPMNKSYYNKNVVPFSLPKCNHNQSKIKSATSGVKGVTESGCHHHLLTDSESTYCGAYNGSEGSEKSQISSKTVISRKSSHDLKKSVKSQCKLLEEINEALKHTSEEIEKVPYMPKYTSAMNIPQSLSHSKRCPDAIQSSSSNYNNKDVTTEIGKDDFPECHSSNTLTITVDDVVNSKVINPMILKLQRMYLNNLKEEMSLMEDLQRLPRIVNEVYKATVFKQNE